MKRTSRIPLVHRNTDYDRKEDSTVKSFRNPNEVQAAYEQVGFTPHRNTKSWYRDIYEFYQNNEV